MRKNESAENPVARRDVLKVLGCSAACVASLPACTFSELYQDFSGEIVTVDLNDEEYIALNDVGGMAPIDVGPFRLNLIRSTSEEVVAIERICPHLQEDMAPIGSLENAKGIYSDGLLICSAHGSQFDLSGAPVGGPSSVGLQTFPCDLALDSEPPSVTVYVGVQPPENSGG